MSEMGTPKNDNKENTLNKIRGKLKNAFSRDSVLDKQALGPKPKKRDFIDDAKDYQQKNPRPWKLGNMYCMWYNSQNQPRIVLGPDWKYSLAELFIINSIAGYFVWTINR